MAVSSWIVLAVITLSLLYAISIYNHLIHLRHNVAQAWSNIDVLMKQRHDEIPKLVDICREHMRYEQETLHKITLARSRVSDAASAENMIALGTAETALRGGLDELFAVVENYPDLKANESFQHLESRITGLESSIADRREFYNASVNIYNVRVDQVPDVILAKAFSFRHKDLLVFSDLETADVSINQLFKRT